MLQEKSTDPQSENDMAQPPNTGTKGNLERKAQMDCENSDLRNLVVTLKAQLEEANKKMETHSCSAGMQPYHPAVKVESANLTGWNDRIYELQKSLGRQMRSGQQLGTHASLCWMISMPLHQSLEIVNYWLMHENVF
jgi:hypothetical protein